MFVFVEGDIFQLVEFVKIEPHAAALRTCLHFDHAFVEFFDKF
jgi:hypothetical protein